MSCPTCGALAGTMIDRPYCSQLCRQATLVYAVDPPHPDHLLAAVASTGAVPVWDTTPGQYRPTDLRPGRNGSRGLTLSE